MNNEIIINHEGELNEFVYKLVEEGRLKKEEADAISRYVCGIFDALSMLGIKEEDLT